MYLEFFKFKKSPFHITPDPEFLFLSPSHKEASASILYGIEQRKGFIAITGEVGVGKTTILRSYLEGTDLGKIKIVYIFNAALSFPKLLKQIFSELGLPVEDDDPAELVDRLFHFLIEEYKNDRNIVLIIDEAQNMPVETLEHLRMLSNLETSQDKLIQIILVGQPEFDRKLDLPELRQLKQRIAIRCSISPLSPEESLAYIQHRLFKASSFFNPVFTKKALKAIVKKADGIPRIINVLCDNALITAFGYQQNPVDAGIIREVIGDFGAGAAKAPFFRWRTIFIALPLVIIGILCFLVRDGLVPREVSLMITAPAVATHTGNQTEQKRMPLPVSNVTEGSAQTAQTLPVEAGGGLSASSGESVAEIPAAEAKPNKQHAPPEMGAWKTERGPVPAHKERAVKAPASEANPNKQPVQPETGSVVMKTEQEPAPSRNPKEAGSPALEAGPNEPRTQPEALPAGEEPWAAKPQKKFATVIIRKGDTIYELLAGAYGRVDPQLVKSFRDLNPQIRNLDRVMVGEEILLPGVENSRTSYSDIEIRSHGKSTP